MAVVRPSGHSAASRKRRPGGGNGVSATEVAVAPPKAVTDLLETDDAKALLEAGKENGHLSADEIAVALDELDLEPAQIDDFYHALEELQIEVVAVEEEEQPVEAPREVSSEATTARSRRWWRRTFVSSSRSPRSTETRVCRSST